jgi:hypothetical protein
MYSNDQSDATKIVPEAQTSQKKNTRSSHRHPVSKPVERDMHSCLAAQFQLVSATFSPKTLGKLGNAKRRTSNLRFPVFTGPLTRFIVTQTDPPDLLYRQMIQKS